MGLVVVALVVGLLAGLATGGRLRELAALPFAGAPLLLAALVVQPLGLALSLLVAPGITWGLAMLVSAALVGVFLALNRSLAGTALIGLGLLANAAVVLANGAMPVSAYAAERSGVGIAAIGDARHEPQTDATRLPLLGDLVPLPLPLRPEVDSLGDLLVAAGVGQLAFVAVRPRRRSTPPGRASAAEAWHAGSDHN